MKSKIAIILLLLNSLLTFSQENKTYEFGKITREEAELKSYEKDPNANALVLFESGNTWFTEGRNNQVVINTVYYKKIKIFNKEAYDKATFKIPLYHNYRSGETVFNIRAITHNGTVQTPLDKTDIYNDKLTDSWDETKFTLPNVQEGSVIEVEYTFQTPFFFNLTGWEFQSDIPKLFSQFKAKVPGNFVYNRSLVGYLKLNTNKATIKNHCFNVTGYTGYSDCEDLVYEMIDVPAFKEEEYMTSEKNFKSKIKFELEKTIWFNGDKQDYTTTWDAVDKEIKQDKNIGKQLKKINELQDILPVELARIPNDLKRAKGIYTFIKNYFTWNEKYSIYKDVNIKDAIADKKGNAGDINIALTNALIAANLNAEIVLISTRNNGFPTRLYPVMSDFNYVISKLTIGEKDYFLDATDKLNPFGILPFRCLNSFGRAMNFKTESKWVDIIPENPSETDITALLKLNEEGKITGQIRIKRTLYNAYDRRMEILNKSNDAIISNFESQFLNIQLIDYKNENSTDIEKPLIEVLTIELDSNDESTLFLNPFFLEKQLINPFNQEDRKYPVDFGYLSSTKIIFSLDIPKNYKIKSFPASKLISLVENQGSFSMQTLNQEGLKISFKSNFTINKPIYFNFEYEGLKQLYKEAITTYATPIVIEKITSLEK